MKLLVIAVISLIFSCLLPFAFGEIDHYALALEEKGTRFLEKIDIDEQKQAAVFHVPAHNDVNGADFYHDYKMRVTVTKIWSQKVCHISKMDPSLPRPEKLKADLDLAATQPGKLPVETKSNLVFVTGPAERSRLTEEILDFCGALPIYNTEEFSATKTEDGTANAQYTNQTEDVIQSRRLKRDSEEEPTGPWTFQHFNHSCKSMAKERQPGNNGPIDFTPLNDCLTEKHRWATICKFKDGSCFYYITCRYVARPSKGWDCSERHTSSPFPMCCNYTCLPIKSK